MTEAGSWKLEVMVIPTAIGRELKMDNEICKRSLY